MEIVCEGQMAYLCDSIQPYTAERQYSGDDTKNGLQEFIDLLLANHNAQVEDYKKIYRGEVTVTTYDSSEGVYKGLNYERLTNSPYESVRCDGKYRLLFISRPEEGEIIITNIELIEITNHYGTL